MEWINSVDNNNDTYNTFIHTMAALKAEKVQKMSKISCKSNKLSIKPVFYGTSRYIITVSNIHWSCIDVIYCKLKRLQWIKLPLDRFVLNLVLGIVFGYESYMGFCAGEVIYDLICVLGFAWQKIVLHIP